MKASIRLGAALAIGAAVAAYASTAGAIAINVINNSGANAYLTFGNAAPTGTYKGNPLNSTTSYLVPKSGELTGMNLTDFRAGRLLFSLGTPLCPGNGCNNPDFQNGGGPGTAIRWDKVELTLDGTPSASANLSSTDFFGLRLGMTNFKTGSSTPFQTVGWNSDAVTVFQDLGQLVKKVGAVKDPFVVVTGPNGVSAPGLGKVLRIISPSTVPPTSTNSYPSLQAYVNYVKSQKITTNVTGQYTGRGNPPSNPFKPQSYNFNATILANGDLQLVGTSSAVAGQVTILIKSADLLTGLLGTNPPYTVGGTPESIGTNNVYSTVVRDILGGFDLGLVGSDAINPNTGHKYRNDPTQSWYVPTVGEDHAYAYAQPSGSACNTSTKPSTVCYNQYAGTIADLGDSYGFPFTDLLGHPLVSLDPSVINRLDITIFPDKSPVTCFAFAAAVSAACSPGPIPEPATAALMVPGLLATAGFALSRRRARSERLAGNA
jgi:hypothetical protein